MKKQILNLLVIVVVAAVTACATMFLATNDYVGVEAAPTPQHPLSPFSENHTTDAQYAARVVSRDYPDLTYAAENAVLAVVNIEATVSVGHRRDPLLEFFGYPQGYGERQAKAGGSGVIISEDGYIVTNNHVIDNATSLRVKLYDGRAYDAKIIGSDPATDVALIKIEEQGLPTLPFGSSDELRLGEWVLAIGYPMDLQSTITAGIVSAKARSLGAIGNKQSIESFIQTDAAVNPGNSGGALVNARGELVGINTIIKTSTGSYVGYSFAVPESIVRKVVEDIKESGSVQRAVLGVSFRAIDQQFVDLMGESTGIDNIGGIYVAAVADGGAAWEAGVRKGDIITAIDGVTTNDAATFMEQIGKRRPGDTITIAIERNAKSITLRVTLQSKSSEPYRTL